MTGGIVTHTGIGGLTLGGGIGHLMANSGSPSTTCVLRRRDRRRPARGRIRRRPRRFILGFARRGRQLRHRHVIRIRCASRRTHVHAACSCIRWMPPPTCSPTSGTTSPRLPTRSASWQSPLAPPLPIVPSELHGKPVVAIIVCYCWRHRRRQANSSNYETSSRPLST